MSCNGCIHENECEEIKARFALSRPSDIPLDLSRVQLKRLEERNTEKWL